MILLFVIAALCGDLGLRATRFFVPEIPAQGGDDGFGGVI